jgi:hypothetical protein
LCQRCSGRWFFYVIGYIVLPRAHSIFYPLITALIVVQYDFSLVKQNVSMKKRIVSVGVLCMIVIAISWIFDSIVAPFLLR